MAKTFAEWATTEVHDPKDKISNLDKLKAPYLLQEYKTWGEVYKAAGIEPPKAKAKTKKVDKSSDLSKSIKFAENILSIKERAILNFEPGTEGYDNLTETIKKEKARIKEFKQRLNAAKATESDTEEKETFQSEKNTYEAKIELAKKKIQIAKDTDGDVSAAEKELESLTSTKPFARDYSKTDAAMAGRAPIVGAKPSTPTDETLLKGKGGTGGGTGDGKEKETPLTDAQQRAEALGVAAGQDFALPETIFNNVDSLKRILERYVKEDWTPDKLRKAIRDDVWFRKNSGEIKARYVQYYNFRDLQASGQAQGTTDYEMQIAKIEASLKKRAVQIGSTAASDPAALRKAAENLYITNRSEDESFIDDFLAASIRPVAGMIGGQGTQGYSGQALKNYQELLTTARSNGLKISDIVPGGSNTQQVLQGIASGKIDINRIVQDTRKLAAQGQPQYVRDLLSQGYNLDQVFAPYRQTMAAVLEIDDPNSINLNDPLLRSAINDKGDMNIYEFKKTLRKDPRWQYTEQARQDVSSATLNILRDFGFQG